MLSNEVKIQYADGMFRSFQFQKYQLSKLYWRLAEVKEELEHGGIRGVSIDPDRIPQSHNITPKGLDIIGLMERKEYLESEYRKMSEPINEIERFLDSLDGQTRRMLKEYYFRNRTYSDISLTEHMEWSAVRRRIRRALLTFAEGKELADE